MKSLECRNSAKNEEDQEDDLVENVLHVLRRAFRNEQAAVREGARPFSAFPSVSGAVYVRRGRPLLVMGLEICSLETDVDPPRLAGLEDLMVARRVKRKGNAGRKWQRHCSTQGTPPCAPPGSCVIVLSPLANRRLLEGRRPNGTVWNGTSPGRFLGQPPKRKVVSQMAGGDDGRLHDGGVFAIA